MIDYQTSIQLSIIACSGINCIDDLICNILINLITVRFDYSFMAFIRIFNSKLFEHRADEMSDNELTWSKWYFPVINTDRSLKAIDHYAQECVRYLVSGTRGKARYRVSYEDMKALGLRSLVGEYYGS